MTTINITTPTTTINIYNNTDKTINPNMYIPTKACYRCRIIKQLTEFPKDTKCHDGYLNQCKDCADNLRKEYVKENKERISNRMKEYYQQNKARIVKNNKEYYETKKENLLEKSKEYYIQHRDKIFETKKENYETNKDTILQNMKEYYIINKNLLLEHSKEYHKLNRNKINNYARNYDEIQRSTNPIYKLISNNRVRIRQALKSNSKAAHTIDLLGCDRFGVYQWIQFHLPYEMSDDEFRQNYHIDHVKAIANFDLSIKENHYEAFGWPNCRPLLKSKNLSKGAKRDIWSELMQKLKVIVFLKLYYPELYSQT